MSERLTAEQRAKIGVGMRARYEQGATVMELAKELDRSFGWAHRVLKEAGTEFRPRGGASHASKLPKAGA